MILRSPLWRRKPRSGANSAGVSLLDSALCGKRRAYEFQAGDRPGPETISRQSCVPMSSRIQELCGPDQVLDLRCGEFAETGAHLVISPALADLGAMQRSLGDP